MCKSVGPNYILELASLQQSKYVCFKHLVLKSYMFTTFSSAEFVHLSEAMAT